MVTMNGNDGHLSSGGASKDTIAPGVPGGLPYMVARDGSQPGSPDAAAPPWRTTAIASGPPRRPNR
jgi:hypothetical protein